MIDKEEQIAISRFIKNMPPLPVSVSKILEVTKNANVDAKELNNIISLDPVLTGRVLKLINSAYYSLTNQVTSIVRAIVMLGINTVKNLLLSTAVLSTVNDKNNFSSLDMDAFWRHSICVGIMAKSFALKENVDPKFIEEYFVAGLLHDIGKIPLNSVVPESYLKVMTYSRQNKLPLYEVEKKYFGFDHCDLGIRIADLWQLNKNLSCAIGYHHRLNAVDPEYKKFTATIALANIITDKLEIGFSGNKSPENLEEEIFKITGLTWDDVDSAENNVEEGIKKAEVFLKIS
ncbi:MAG: HDOD domain-containing protein [Spirochaetes bacterium]|nr:HDOD domain-containing protein [Spirochaetota bacterium]